MAKPVRITDNKALSLIEARAKAESRSNANAAAVTIIEALGNNKPGGGNRQGEIIGKNSTPDNKGE
jgi:hypothetical protein